METSWLPGFPEVKRALGPGFQRQKSGSYRCELPAGDTLQIVRRATKALAWLLEEEWGT